ncbi:MAG: serine/threonine protein kinase [Candidatus Bathyarchaeota archaeon]|nr:serine/threonine protein kinase [Candidatus Bathyarchaeota archaeon]
MKIPTTIPLEQLDSEPYASILCYPRTTATEIQNRVSELRALGIETLEFSGKTSAFNVPVLGKGYVGIVVVAHVRSERFALKIRRVDADRVNLKHEAEMLQRANAVGVGPQFVAVSDNFLLSQLVDGDLLGDWLGKHKTSGAVRRVLVDILEQCWRLDEAGLDHGELSKAPKHLLVDKSGKPFIVDFETASTQRNASNVTSVCQFLFQGNSNTAKSIAQILGVRNKQELVNALKNYKKNRTRSNFEALLQFYA